MKTKDDLILPASSEKEGREEFALMKDFFEYAPALFCFLEGPEYIFESANKNFLRVFGNYELAKKSFGEIYPQWEDMQLKKILDDVYNTGIDHSADKVKLLFGTENREVFLDINCQAQKNGNAGVTGIRFFAYEVTQQVVNRQKETQNNIELEKKAQERIAWLESANNLLEQSNANLKEFASIASHDLQEPLRKIRTFSEVLRKDYATAPGKGLGIIGKIEAASFRMSVLIRDLLNYSKLLNQEKINTKADLNEILKNVLEDFELVIEEKSAVIKKENEFPVIDAIPLHMNQLFYNLIGNALKFSGKETIPQINISCTVINSQMGRVPENYDPLKIYYQLIVKDNGIGFSPEFAEQIFSVFERLNSRDDYEGTGIGLALCRKIVNNHRGVIWAMSETGLGTSVFIILPASQ